jgi:hypothetical protein
VQAKSVSAQLADKQVDPALVQALEKLPHFHHLLKLLIAKTELQKEVELLCSALQGLLHALPMEVGCAISRWPLLLCSDDLCQVCLTGTLDIDVSFSSLKCAGLISKCRHVVKVPSNKWSTSKRLHGHRYKTTSSPGGCALVQCILWHLYFYQISVFVRVRRIQGKQSL